MEKIGLEAILLTDKWKRGVTEVTNGTDRMKKELSGFDKSLAAFGKQGIASFQNLGKVALGAGAAIASAGVAAGAAIGAFAIGGIKKAADLEAQLSGIAATLNTTRENIAPLKDLIMDLALDPNLVVSTTEAADAVENLARNGLNMTQIMDGAARSVVLLANATGAEFGQAADILTDVMAQFNLTAADTPEIVDQITAVTNLSKFTIDDYGLAIAQAGGVAGAVGMDLADLNLSLIATASSFSSGSDAGTSFKTFLTSMVPKSNDAAKAMNLLGIEFFDANGQVKSVIEISEELNDAFLDEITFSTQVSNMTAEQTAQKKLLEGQLKRTGNQLFLYQAGINGVAQSEEDKAVSIDRLNRQHEAAMTAYEGLATSMGTTVTVTRHLTEAEKIKYANDIAGVDGMRTLFGLAEAGTVIYTDAALAAKELGVSQEEVNKVLEGGVTQIEAYQLQMDQIEAEEQAAERMRNFKGVLNIVQGAIEALQIIIGDAFLPVLTVLAQRFNELISAIGPAAIKPFQDLGAALTNMFAAIEGGKEPLDVFMAFMIGFGPQGVAVASSISGVALAIGGVVFAVGLVLQPITDAVAKFVEWQDVLIVLGAAILMVVVPAIVGMLTAMAPIILIIGGAILAVAALRTAWESDWLGIQTKTTEAVSAIQTAFAPFTTAVQTHMQGALAEVKAFATGNETEWMHTQAIWEGVKESVANLFGSIVGTVLLNYPIWWATLQTWGFAAGQWILNAAAVVGTHIATYTTALITEITNKLPDWSAKLTEWSTAAGAWLTTASAEIGTKLGEWYTALSTALGGKLASWKISFTEWTQSAWQWIVTAAGLVSAKIDEWYTALSGAVIAKLTTWKTAFVDWITELSAWIAKSIPFVTTEIGAWYTKLAADVAAKLPTFTAEMLKWATKLVEWISSETANALPHLGTWLGKFIAWIPTGAVLLGISMLQMATKLVEWIGSDAASALPHLGAWLGKILAWIPLAVGFLAVKVVELAGALVGWISGTGGVAVEDSAEGKLAAEFEKFKTALGTAITQMWEGIKGFVQAFGQSFWDELGIKIDWNQLGMDIITKIWNGVELMKALVTGTFIAIATDAYNFFLDTDWLGLGYKVILTVKDGIVTMASVLLRQMLTTARNTYDEFLKIDWIQLGKDIISEIVDGLESAGQQIIDYIVGLGQQALDSILGLFGAGGGAEGDASASSVMRRLGRSLVNGLAKGIDEQQTRLKRSVGRMTSSIFDTMIRGAERATDALSGLAGSFAGTGSGWVDALNAMTEIDPKRPAGQVSAINYERQKKTLDTLKQQADLINLIRESGGNPSEILAGITLGKNADPKQLLDAVNRTMAVLNAQLEQSVKTAATTLPETVEKLRANRRSIEDIEATFIATHLDQKERYAQGLAKVDGQIARLEQDLLATGNKALLPMIEALDIDRKKIMAGLQTYLEQTNLLQKAFAGIKNLTGPGQESAQRFVDDQIQPILDAFAAPMGETERAAWLRAVQERAAMVNVFVDQMQALAPLFQKISDNKAFDHLADEVLAIQNIAVPEATRSALLKTLQTYVTQIERFQALQQDLSVGIGADPLVARFKSEKLDTIAKQLENINLSEAERGRLIEQYRIEQEKILAIQQKQSQLDFLKQQLDLLNQVKDLDDKFGDLVPVADIFAGVQFGVNASIDSLVGAVSKAIDAMIRVTNKELGIASPSKVFEQIGKYMMSGLARGIETSVMRPINSLSGAISELPYALGGRSLTLNMGGVSISNGMDEVMFEARVRQILDRAFP